MGLPIPGHFLRERESTRIGSTMHGLCSLLCSSGPLNVWNVKFHLAATSSPNTFAGRGMAELWEALQKPRSWCHQRNGHRRQNKTSCMLCKWEFYGAVKGGGGEAMRFWLLCSVTECGYAQPCLQQRAAVCRLLRAEVVAEGWNPWRDCTGARL